MRIHRIHSRDTSFAMDVVPSYSSVSSVSLGLVELTISAIEKRPTTAIISFINNRSKHQPLFGVPMASEYLSNIIISVDRPTICFKREKKSLRMCGYLGICRNNMIRCGPGSVVGIAIAYGLDGPGIEFRWRGWRFSAPVQTGSEAHPASCTMGTGPFPRGKCGRDVTLTPQPLLLPRSKIE